MLRKNGFAVGVCAASLASTTALHAIEVQWSSPDLDRWNYPHLNGGKRNNGSTFSSIGQGPGFDDRMAQVLLGFNTAAQGIPSGLAAGQYQITSIKLTATVFRDSLGVYDPTYDAVATYTGGVDRDAGRPIELYGVGFRGGYTQFDFGPDDASAPGYSEAETSTAPNVPNGFGESTNPGDRFVFAADVSTGSLRDVSNNVAGNFDTSPFAVGQTTLNPGDQILLGTTFTFDIDLSDPLILAYLQSGLSIGQLEFALSSLHAGSGTVGFPYVDFFMRESPTFLDGAIPITLAIEFEVGAAGANAIPEPTSLAMLSSGAIALLSMRRRRVH